MAFAAQDRPSDLRLKGHLIVFPAMIANYFETLSRIIGYGLFLRPTLRAPLRRRHVPLIEHLLFLFGKEESFLTLNTSNIGIRHGNFSFLKRI